MVNEVDMQVIYGVEGNVVRECRVEGWRALSGGKVVAVMYGVWQG